VEYLKGIARALEEVLDIVKEQLKKWKRKMIRFRIISWRQPG